jgi:hypothetical protein
MTEIKKILCLTPVYNDWDSLNVLVENISFIQNEFKNKVIISLLIVNDGSIQERINFNSKLTTTFLNLKLNIGHQRAIAVGLQYIYNQISDFDFVVVIDCDGEDKPEHIIPLLIKAESEDCKKIVFAQRNKRQESYIFKIGYILYKYLFYFLTGQKINFGNYSIIPKNILSKVVHQSNIWNHYSGSIIQSKVPFDKLLLDRGKRYKGVSKMNFNNLIIHGLSSIAVYFDFLSLRILRFSLYGIAICFISVMYILFQKIFTNTAIPGWASSLIHF